MDVLITIKGFKPYANKDEKNIDMDDALTLNRLATQRASKFIFLFPLRFIFQDLFKKGILKPFDLRAEDDNMDFDN